jgi:hypothetical protein
MLFFLCNCQFHVCEMVNAESKLFYAMYLCNVFIFLCVYVNERNVNITKLTNCTLNYMEAFDEE